MKRGFRFLAFGIFVLLVVIFGIYLLTANSANLAFSVAGNGTTITMFWFNVSATNNTGGNNLTSVSINQTITGSNSNVTNVTISNGTVYYNSSCCTFPVVIGIGQIINTTTTNFTVNFTINTSAANNATIQANLTANDSQNNVTFFSVNPPYNSTIVTIDSVGPTTAYSSVGTVANASNNIGNLTVNVTATDLLGLANITIYVNGTQRQQCSTSPCSYTNNSVDGSYVFNATANDTNGATTTLSSRTVLIDNTAPTDSPSCNSVEVGSNFPCSCASSDSTSGVNTITGSSNSPDGTSSPTRNTGNFIYTCTVTDFAGNSVIATKAYTISFNTGGARSGGGITTTTWITTIVTDSAFAQGYTTQLAANNRLKVQVAAQDHYIGVLSISGAQTTIQISSNPLNITLSPGQNATVDVNSDGFYDIYVLLNGITNNQANLTIKQIHDAVLSGSGAIQTTGQVNGQQSQKTSPSEKNLIWILFVVGLVVLVLLFLGIRKKK